jgi:hypothetical protein
MSIRWRCAICEAVNDGGDTCAACGAKVTQTVVQAPPAEAAPAPKRTEASEGTVRNEAATEIPVRELPRRGRLEPDRPDDVYDLFDLAPAYDSDATYDTYEPIDTRPRVRVYGCCLPIALGGLLAFLATVALLVNLVIGVL